LPVVGREVDGILGIITSAATGAPDLDPQLVGVAQATLGDGPLHNRGCASTNGSLTYSADVAPAGTIPGIKLGVVGAIRWVIHPSVGRKLGLMWIVDDHAASPGVASGAVGVVGGVDIKRIFTPIVGSEVGVDFISKVVVFRVLRHPEVDQVYGVSTLRVSSGVSRDHRAVRFIHHTVNYRGKGVD